MDRFILQRKPIRQLFTVTYETLNNILSEDEEIGLGSLDLEKIETDLSTLNRLGNELDILDEKVINFILDLNDEDQLTNEYKEKEQYKYKLDKIRIKVECIRNKSVSHSQSSRMSSPTTKKKLKLPKLELKQFGGEIKDWLSFWSQFKRIHEDRDMQNEDKFQYLIQTMIKGSKARDIVESFPPTKENYQKAIDVLKNRYGRDELLIEHYVRELINLVIENSTTPKSKIITSTLYDRLESHLRALESIGMTRDKYEAMLFPLVESCIPEDMLRAWLRSSSINICNEGTSEESSYSNRLQQLLLFMKGEVESEERITMARVGFKHNQKRDVFTLGQSSKTKFERLENIPTASSLYSAGNQGISENKKQIEFERPKSILCVFCDKHHESKECFNAQKMTLDQKRDILAKKRACFSCLKIGHRSKDCKCNLKCLICSKKHYPILCSRLPDTQDGESNRTNIDSNTQGANHNKNENKSSSSLTSQSCESLQQVFLQTLIVKLCNGTKTRSVRALLDNGSQRSYILKNTVKEMEYEYVGKEDIVHALFGGIKSDKTSHKKYEIEVTDVLGTSRHKLSVLDQSIICNTLSRLQYGPWYDEIRSKNIYFSDIGNSQPEIELLIGADTWSYIITGNTLRLECGLLAMETSLGWPLLGTLITDHENHSNSYSTMVTSLFVHSENLSNLWNLDVLGIKDPYENKTREDMEIAARKHFESTVSINEEGRYEIMLPWVEPQEKLKTNKNVAEKRLWSTSEKLVIADKFNAYEKVFIEWETQGIIEEVKEKDLLYSGYFLPHRPVIKEESTTKIRPVFDASSKQKGSFSLNDCLEKGPNVIELIPSILLRFRENKIGVTSDIEKAFLQISINTNDCNYLKFLWWENYNEKTLKVYKHRRVVFGINCSPFMLGAVINYHLNNSPQELKTTVDKLKLSFYVDNCVTSCETKSELREFIKNSTEIMKTAKFNLRDWQSSIDPCENQKPTKVLGLLWDKYEDKLYCDIKDIKPPEIVTRRNILSTVQKVFDPIGFSCPFTLIPKLILQESWRSKIDWDAEVAQEVKNKFLKWIKDLPDLSKVKINRYIGLLKNNDVEHSLHIFCDASKSAYAAVVYLRTKINGVVNLQLVMAKSRVSPLKAMTIPRLELMACLIGTRLVKTAKLGLGDNLKNISEFYWTDSSTALVWIMKDELWGQFVQNRVKEIREESGKRWRHVPGHLNPADIPSRGCSMKVLLESQWWEGPTWLKNPESGWPESDVNVNNEEINVERKGKIEVLTNTQTEKNQWYLNYFSEYFKVVRMVAWIMRFRSNVRKPPPERIKRELLVSEINSAENYILKQVQHEAFDKRNLTVIKSLCVFEDNEGLIRVKTKLINRSGEEENFKYPIVLPNNHNIVQLLIREWHIKLSHAGLNTLLTKLREKFWILKGRRTVRSIINRCIICRRHSAKNLQTEPASLPSDRVQDAAVFEKVGVDLAGPLILKGGDKTWITIYTCAVYRAVHFELISSLSTNGFILGLRRFIARRGRPKVIYSDNGTNFVGTENLFRGIDWTYVERESTNVWRIQWIFIPPTAAWWGGWWERIVQIVKGILKRVLKRASVNYEEMSCILCDAEAVINSRPLTYIPDEMEDIVPLTPAMFLQENSNVNVTDLDIIDDSNLSKRYRYQQRLREDLRKRFRNEYLSNLVMKNRPNKNTNCLALKEGDVVLIGSEGKKRLEWPLGKILQLYPGKDKVVRVAKLKTANGEIIRPVQRLYSLEISRSEENNLHKYLKDSDADNMTSRTKRISKLPPKFVDYKM